MNEKARIVEGKIIETLKPNEIYLALFDQGYGWQISGMMYHTPDEVVVNLAAFNPKQIVIVKVEMPEKYECEDEGKPEVTGVKVSPDVKDLVDPTSPDGKAGKEFGKVLGETTNKVIVGAMKDSLQPNPIAHVVNEWVQIPDQGTFKHLLENSDGRIILESIVFTKAKRSAVDSSVLGTCDKDGNIIPVSRILGIMGRVNPDGQCILTAIKGIDFHDTLYVSYNYEYESVHPKE